MTKEEYILKRNSLRSAIQELNQHYINDNKPCNLGDVIANDHDKGIVRDFKITEDADIKPIAYKLKKDGSESVYKLYTWGGYTVLNQKTTS